MIRDCLSKVVNGLPVTVYHGAEKGRGYKQLPIGRYTTLSLKQAKRYPFQARGETGENEIYCGTTIIPSHLLVVQQAKDLLDSLDSEQLTVEEATSIWDEGLREYQLDTPLKIELAFQSGF